MNDEHQEQLDCMARALADAKALLDNAVLALDEVQRSINREAWQEGATLAESTKRMLYARDNIRAFDPTGYDRRLKHARQMAVDKMNARDAALKALRQVLRVGHSDDCLFCGFKDKKACEALGVDPAKFAVEVRKPSYTTDLTGEGWDNGSLRP